MAVRRTGRLTVANAMTSSTSGIESTPRTKAAATKKRVAEFFFLDGERVRFVPMRLDLRDALTAAEVPAPEFLTLLTLYGHALVSVLDESRPATEEAQVVIALHMLAAERGLVPRAVTNHLRNLEKMEILRRGKSSPGLAHIFLLPVRQLLARLYGMPEVTQRLQLMRPQRYSAAGIEAAQSAITRKSTSEGESDAHSTQMQQLAQVEAVVVEEREVAHSPALREFAVVESSTETRAPNTRVTTSEVEQLLQLLGEAIRHRLQSSFHLTPTSPNIFHLRQLAEQYGTNNVRSMIDFVTDPQHWAELRTRRKIESPVPTPGVIRGFSADIVALSVDEWDLRPAKRSGGAQVLPLGVFRRHYDDDGF